MSRRSKKKVREGFAEGILLWRESLGMTQRQFAAALGIERHTAFNWEQRASYPGSIQWLKIRDMVEAGTIPVPNVAKAILLKEQTNDRTD